MEQGNARGELAIAADASVADLYLWLHMDPQASHEAMRPVLEEATRVFESTGDLGGLANALYLAGQMRFWRGDAEGAIAELERAADHARESGDRTLEAEILRSVLTAARSGSMPAEAMVKLAAEVMRRVPGSRRLEMGALATRAEVSAMQGDFEAARALLRQAMTLEEEVGLKTMATTAAEVELLAGDGREAERHARQDLEALARIGDWGHYVSMVPPLVDALFLQGRGQEARAPVELAARYVIDDDMDAQLGIRSSQAKLLLLDGDVGAAEERARGSVTLAASSDFTKGSVRALSVLADVLHRSGRPEEAAAVLTEAIGLCDQKGNLVRARELRTALEALAAQPPATA
jgi:ATP/maltotriose-dependent transcriptional regulator MalT